MRLKKNVAGIYHDERAIQMTDSLTGGRLYGVDMARFIANYMVVGIHLFILCGSTTGGIGQQFLHFFSQVVCPIAMPALFVISGYVCFVKKQSYGSLIGKKVARLIVPYFFWNGIVAVLYCLGFSASFDPSWLLEKTFSISAAPADMPTWYMRALFVYTLVSPLVVYLVDGIWGRVCFIALVSLLSFLVNRFQLEASLMYSYPLYSFVCFSVGALVAREGAFAALFGNLKIRAGWFALAGGTLIVQDHHHMQFLLGPWVKVLQGFVVLSLGVCLASFYKKMPRILRESAFWLYLAHLPVFQVVSSILWRIWPYESLWGRLLVGLGISSTLVFSSFVLLNRYLPFMMCIANGQWRWSK